MCSQQPPFDQRRDPVDSRQQGAGVLAAPAGTALIARFVCVAEPADAPVGIPAVGDHVGSRFDVIGDEGMQGRRGPVREDRHPAPPVPARLQDLHGDANQDLLALGAATRQPGFHPADVGLIDFDSAG